MRSLQKDPKGGGRLKWGRLVWGAVCGKRFLALNPLRHGAALLHRLELEWQMRGLMDRERESRQRVNI